MMNTIAATIDGRGSLPLVAMEYTCQHTYNEHNTDKYGMVYKIIHYAF